MIDTHCHLGFPDFASDLPGVLARAERAGVSGMITIATTLVDAVAGLRLARAHERVWCTAGVHPLYADQGPHEWAALRVLWAEPKCVAWGELGLDNHYREPLRAVQHAVLEEQLAALIALAGEGITKPIVLHCREAFDDLIPILRGTGLPGDRFVFHCFTAGPDEARACLDLGAMVSFTGVVTYRNAPEVREAARLIPRDRILVETDAPFLSPEPVRGTRPCEPAFAMHTARSLAELRGEAWDVFHAAINENTARFFGVA